MITIEGGEGVGKSLLQEKLATVLKKSLGKHNLITTREPGGTPAAQQIRQLFAAPPADDPLLIETEAFLVSAARAQHVGRVIAPSLARGDWVLCDRFADSTRVYQGFLGGLPAPLIETLISLSTQNLQPDVTFLLDCAVEKSLERLAARRHATGDAVQRYDAAAQGFHSRLRQAYLDLVALFPERFIRLDAALPAAQVFEQALVALRQRFASELEAF